MKKRGLSDVVTVALVILLAIAAVVIVWTFVRATLENVGKQVTDVCVSTNVKINSCDSTADLINIESLQGGETIDKVKFIKYNTDGTTGIFDNPTGCTPIKPLEKKNCAIGAITAGEEFGVVAIVKTTECPMTARKVICEA